MTWKTKQDLSESDENSVGPIEDANQDDVELVEAPVDPLAQLQADVNAAKAEVAEWQDRFLRKAAEFENYRKRSEKDRIEAMALAKSTVLIEFLPVADACERALNSLGEAKTGPQNLQQFQQGVELLYKQLLDTLGRVGVTPIEAEGNPFDPHLHEALSREINAEVKENTVVKELRRGYLFKDKLLRPTQVIVAVHPELKDKTP